MWTYRCYDDGKTPNLWHRWYFGPEAPRGAHDSAFEILEQLEQWQKPNAKKLSNGVIEVKMFGGVQWRVFGYYPGGTRHEFVVVAVGSKKGNVYSPKAILDTAKKRIAQCKLDPGKATACERPQ